MILDSTSPSSAVNLSCAVAADWDKLSLAALEGTLLLYLDPERADRVLPVLAHLLGSRSDA